MCKTQHWAVFLFFVKVYLSVWNFFFLLLLADEGKLFFSTIELVGRQP